jgi:hypothetical protein
MLVFSLPQSSILNKNLVGAGVTPGSLNSKQKKVRTKRKVQLFSWPQSSFNQSQSEKEKSNNQDKDIFVYQLRWQKSPQKIFDSLSLQAN